MEIKKRCKKPLCKNLHNNKSGYCDTHQIKKTDKNYYKQNDYQKYYNTSSWKNFSKRYIKRYPVCVNCGATENLVCDHKIPIQIYIDIFGYNKIDDENHFQTLCVSCNNRKKSQDKKQVEKYFRNGKKYRKV